MVLDCNAAVHGRISKNHEILQKANKHVEFNFLLKALYFHIKMLRKLPTIMQNVF